MKLLHIKTGKIYDSDEFEVLTEDQMKWLH